MVHGDGYYRVIAYPDALKAVGAPGEDSSGRTELND